MTEKVFQSLIFLCFPDIQKRVFYKQQLHLSEDDGMELSPEVRLQAWIRNLQPPADIHQPAVYTSSPLPELCIHICRSRLFVLQLRLISAELERGWSSSAYGHVKKDKENSPQFISDTNRYAVWRQPSGRHVIQIRWSDVSSVF